MSEEKAAACWKCGHSNNSKNFKFCIKCGAKPAQSPGPAPAATPVTTSASPSPPADAAHSQQQHQQQHQQPPQPTTVAHHQQQRQEESSSSSPSSTPPLASTASCTRCGKELSGTVAVDAKGRRYHQACFTCCVCEKVLTAAYHAVAGGDGDSDLIYCAEDYRARSAPACATCGKPIAGSGAQDHTGAKHHIECFVCKRCGKPIVGAYALDPDGDRCCGSCRSSATAAASSPAAGGGDAGGSSADVQLGKCAGCSGELAGEVVGVGSSRFHPRCFVCAGCKTSLISGQFHLGAEGQLHCKNCLLKERGQYCSACGQLITEGAALHAMTKIWHEACFKCANCDVVIASSQPFAVRDETPVCVSCATNRS